MWDPVLELTHNHGTEKEVRKLAFLCLYISFSLRLLQNFRSSDRQLCQEGLSYHNGNAKEFKGKPVPRGFGHIGFLVDDLDEFCSLLYSENVPFIKKPSEGSMKTLAFVQDPTGYWIEIVQRKCKF